MNAWAPARSADGEFDRDDQRAVDPVSA